MDERYALDALLCRSIRTVVQSATEMLLALSWRTVREDTHSQSRAEQVGQESQRSAHRPVRFFVVDEPKKCTPDRRLQTGEMDADLMGTEPINVANGLTIDLLRQATELRLNGTGQPAKLQVAVERDNACKSSISNCIHKRYVQKVEIARHRLLRIPDCSLDESPRFVWCVRA
jgi:hypothetical protein